MKKAKTIDIEEAKEKNPTKLIMYQRSQKIMRKIPTNLKSKDRIERIKTEVKMAASPKTSRRWFRNPKEMVT